MIQLIVTMNYTFNQTKIVNPIPDNILSNQIMYPTTAQTLLQLLTLFISLKVILLFTIKPVNNLFQMQLNFEFISAASRADNTGCILIAQNTPERITIEHKLAHNSITLAFF